MPDPLKKAFARTLRDSFHNHPINAENELDDEVYFNQLQSFIEQVEGCREEAYYDGILDPHNKNQFISMAKFYEYDDDKRAALLSDASNRRGGVKPIITVGIGFNINSQSTQNHFDTVLGKPGHFAKVAGGEINLSREDIAVVFKDCVQGRLSDLKGLYGKTWQKLRANERIAIHSLYFNNPRLANHKTQFYQHIMKYGETKDPKYLKLAVEEVEKRSNRDKNPGIQNRRDAEAALLNSTQCHFS